MTGYDVYYGTNVRIVKIMYLVYIRSDSLPYITVKPLTDLKKKTQNEALRIINGNPKTTSVEGRIFEIDFMKGLKLVYIVTEIMLSP